MTRAAEALIDLDALRHNLRAVRVATSGRRVMAVIKANAYGHGIVDVARALHESDAFAVACLDEAMTLRAAGIAQLIVLLEGFFSADEHDDKHTQQQNTSNKTAVADLPGERSIANSAGVLAWPETQADWVRPGISLYGVSPFAESRGVDLGLKPVMTLQSQLISVQQRSRGERIGYGGDYLCTEDMTVGVVAIGYGDGYPRQVRSGTPVLVNG